LISTQAPSHLSTSATKSSKCSCYTARCWWRSKQTTSVNSERTRTNHELHGLLEQSSLRERKSSLPSFIKEAQADRTEGAR
jgi:hypothetical protein